MSRSFKDYLFYLPPVLTILLVPFLMERHSTIVSLALFCLVLFLGLVKKGFTMEILAIVLCTPSLVAIYENENVNIRQFNILIVLFPYIFFFAYLLLKSFKRRITFNVRKWEKYSLFFLLITLAYAVIFGTFSIYIPNELTYVCMTFCFFIIACKDKQDIKDQLNIMDILFFITCFFVVLQYILQMSPYDWAYQQFERRIGDAFRASGLLGNSLTLSCYLLLYECFLLTRVSLTNRVPWIKLSLCFLIGLMTISRTTLVLSIVIVFFWLFFTKKIKSFSTVFFSVLFLITIIYILQNLLPDSVEALLDRIENDNVNHRTASYGTVFNIFMNHPFGVGNNFLDVINRERLYTDGFIRDMPTFDNYFLTAIARYGIFSAFVFYFDYYLLFSVFKRRKTYKRIIPFFLLFFTIRSLLGLSYNIESYLIFNVPFFIYLAYLFRWKDTQSLVSYDNNKNTL